MKASCNKGLDHRHGDHDLCRCDDDSTFEELEMTEFTVGKLLGRGSHGAVFELTSTSDQAVDDRDVDPSFTGSVTGSGTPGLGSPTPTRSVPLKVAMKVELEGLRNSPITNEFKAYRRLEGCYGVPGVLDFVNMGGYVMMVLPLLGESLRSTAVRQNFDDAFAIRATYSLLLTLQDTHTRGVVHRDIKPRNILLSQDRCSLCLVDWGIATSIRPSPVTVRRSGPRSDRRRTGSLHGGSYGIRSQSPRSSSGRKQHLSSRSSPWAQADVSSSPRGGGDSRTRRGTLAVQAARTRQRGKLTGTIRYASVFAHGQERPGPRDDLESLVYTIVETRGISLPWSKEGTNLQHQHQHQRHGARHGHGVKGRVGCAPTGLSRAGSRADIVDNVRIQKENATPSEVCAGLPLCFEALLVKARELVSNELPDYPALLEMFREEGLARGFDPAAMDARYDHGEFETTVAPLATPRSSLATPRQHGDRGGGDRSSPGYGRDGYSDGSGHGDGNGADPQGGLRVQVGIEPDSQLLSNVFDGNRGGGGDCDGDTGHPPDANQLMAGYTATDSFYMTTRSIVEVGSASGSILTRSLSVSPSRTSSKRLSRASSGTPRSAYRDDGSVSTYTSSVPPESSASTRGHGGSHTGGGAHVPMARSTATGGNLQVELRVGATRTNREGVRYTQPAEGKGYGCGDGAIGTGGVSGSAERKRRWRRPRSQKQSHSDLDNGKSAAAASPRSSSSSRLPSLLVKIKRATSAALSSTKKRLQ